MEIDFFLLCYQGQGVIPNTHVAEIIFTSWETIKMTTIGCKYYTVRKNEVIIFLPKYWLIFIGSKKYWFIFILVYIYIGLYLSTAKNIGLYLYLFIFTGIKNY